MPSFASCSLSSGVSLFLAGSWERGEGVEGVVMFGLFGLFGLVWFGLVSFLKLTTCLQLMLYIAMAVETVTTRGVVVHS